MAQQSRYDFIGETARALGFLSRLPIPQRFFAGHDGVMRATSGMFAIAGLIVAIPPALFLFILLYFGIRPELAALLALALQIGLTGALHEDGLADCADGFGGGRTRERMLEIMKDSRLGAYGGLALVLSIGLRLEAIAAIGASAGPLVAAAALLAANAAARAALVWHWSALAPARVDGVAAAVGQPDKRSRDMALATGVLSLALLLIPTAGGVAFLTSALLALVAALAFTRLTRGKIQGHTGDTLGACEQTVEIAIYVALAITA